MACRTLRETEWNGWGSSQGFVFSAVMWELAAGFLSGIIVFNAQLPSRQIFTTDHS